MGGCFAALSSKRIYRPRCNHPDGDRQQCNEHMRQVQRDKDIVIAKGAMTAFNESTFFVPWCMSKEYAQQVAAWYAPTEYAEQVAKEI